MARGVAPLFGSMELAALFFAALLDFFSAYSFEVLLV
jgi:hypothetical protein